LGPLSRREYDALAYDEELRKSGHYIVSNALQQFYGRILGLEAKRDV
jgi:hypothetical protein